MSKFKDEEDKFYNEFSNDNGFKVKIKYGEEEPGLITLYERKVVRPINDSRFVKPTEKPNLHFSFNEVNNFDVDNDLKNVLKSFLKLLVTVGGIVLTSRALQAVKATEIIYGLQFALSSALFSKMSVNFVNKLKRYINYKNTKTEIIYDTKDIESVDYSKKI